MRHIAAGPAVPTGPAVSHAAAPRRTAVQRAFGALDLGTNNCRLLIARRLPDSGPDGDFRVIDAFSRIVRLGEGLAETGRLADAAMDRTVAALAACAEKLARRGVHQVRSVATEACRVAANGAEFVRRVYEETGIALDVITPAEEARLAVIGCQTLIDCDSRRTLVFDIGGGSTEIAITRRSRRKGAGTPMGELPIQAWLSVPWGVVSLAEAEPDDPGTVAGRIEAYARMKARVAAHLRPLAASLSPQVRLLGASGTVTTLASLNMGFHHYDRRQVDGSVAATADLLRLAHELAARSPAERAAMPGVGRDRADLVVAGCAILEALVDAAGADSIRVADRGLREGMLRQMFQREDGQ